MSLALRARELAGSSVGLWLLFAWGFGEALLWPIVPDFPLVLLVVVAPPRRWAPMVGAALGGSLLGGAMAYLVGALVVIPGLLLVTDRMIVEAVARMTSEGAWALLSQPLSGIPFKVFAYHAFDADLSFPGFLLTAGLARGLRMGAVAVAFGVGSHAVRRWMDVLYLPFAAVFTLLFAVGLAGAVRAWS